MMNAILKSVWISIGALLRFPSAGRRVIYSKYGAEARRPRRCEPLSTSRADTLWVGAADLRRENMFGRYGTWTSSSRVFLCLGSNITTSTPLNVQRFTVPATAIYRVIPSASEKHRTLQPSKLLPQWPPKRRLDRGPVFQGSQLLRSLPTSAPSTSQ